MITISKLTPTSCLSTLSMADTGANVCITNDCTLLYNLWIITPVPLGVVVNNTGSSPALCSQQGFLPIQLLDGSCHMQPFLFSPHATDTILSPAHIMWSCDKIAMW